MDPGSYDSNTQTLDVDKVFGKLNFNLNQNNKLSVRHSYAKAVQLEARRSGRRSINFLNGSETFESITHSSALEWNSIIGSNMSNNLIIGATLVRDDRDVLGDPFPAVSISDGPEAGISLGAETFSTANLLDQDVITLNNNFELFKGKHNWLFGINAEYFYAANLFIRDNYGAYSWQDSTNEMTGDLIETGTSRFLRGAPADQYSRSFFSGR